MRPGDVLENAIWLTGEEPAEMVRRYQDECAASIKAAAHEAGFLVAPLVWSVKRPGDHRVPPVPDHIHGPDVRLMVAEAKILCRSPQLVATSFLSELEPKDLERLRQITRRAHRKHNPTALPLTDQQCDRVIEEIGPGAALDSLRKAVDTRIIN